MKLILFVIFLLTFLGAQQIGSTTGTNLNGDAWDRAGQIPAAKTSSYVAYFDIDDYYWWDANPLFSNDVLTITGSSSDSVGVDSIYGSTTSTVAINSDRSVFGTLFVAFDNFGTASPTTDSVLYTISATPGVYTTNSRALASVDWGDAITLETVATINDYFSINNVYFHATKYKHFPPEVWKFTLASINRSGWDDSTKVRWTYRYPQVIKTVKERKDREGD